MLGFSVFRNTVFDLISAMCTKFTPSVENSVDPDQLASEEAS